MAFLKYVFTGLGIGLIIGGVTTGMAILVIAGGISVIVGMWVIKD